MSVVPAATDPGRPAEDSEPASVPAVVAVVVARDPGEWFAETLRSLGAQDYPNLAVLVVDAGSAEPVADRVAELLPTAFLHRVTGDPGFSAAANRALELVSGASFLLFCHDDVALDARCVSALVEEAYRSNAGICGPKLVQWDDPERLLQVGVACDRFGMVVDRVDRGELDQQQYDGVRDVFVVPGGVQLVRTDLFVAIGGFDPGIPLEGEDLDLCWRGRIAGARVVVVPDAVARHLEALDSRPGVEDRSRLRSRHRLRTLLVTGSGWTLLWLGPLSVLLLLFEGLYALMAGRRRQAGDALAALGWNLLRLGDIHAGRRRLRSFRRTPDSEVHTLQLPATARFGAFLREQVGSERFGGLVGSLRESVIEVRAPGATRDGLLLAGLALLLVLAGGRHLLTSGVDPVGQVPALPVGRTVLLEEWLASWRSAGLGGPEAAPTAFALLGLAQVVLAPLGGLSQTLVVLAPIAIGPVGAWRLVRPFGSPRASGVAMVAYAASPLLTSALSGALWPGLVMYAAAPFLLGSLLRLQGGSPYGDLDGPRGRGVVNRALPARLARLALLVALVAAFVPAVLLAVVLLVAALAVAAAMTGRWSAGGRVLLAVPTVAVGALALHLPWALAVLERGSWDWFVGGPSPAARFDSLADLARFATGSGAPGVAAVGLLVVAGLPLLIARDTRFDTAVAGWLVALGCWGAVWAERRGWIGATLPSAEVLLAPALAGLCLAAGMAVLGVDRDLRRRAVGWRRFAVLVAVGALAVSVLGGFVGAANGRWGYPRRGYTDTTTSAVAQLPDPAGRVLWLGDRRVLPVAGWPVRDEVEFALTASGQPDASSDWVLDDPGRTGAIADLLRLAADGQTVRLGRLLAFYGIDLVVVVGQLAPTPYDGPSFSTGPIGASLADQLDLERLAGAADLAVYRNTASQGVAVGLPAELLPLPSSQDPAELLDVSLADATRLDVRADGPGRWVGQVADGTPVLLAVPDEGGWQAEGARTRLGSALGSLIVVEPGPGGELRVTDSVSLSSRLLLATQAVLVAGAVAVGQRRRDEEVPIRW